MTDRWAPLWAEMAFVVRDDPEALAMIWAPHAPWTAARVIFRLSGLLKPSRGEPELWSGFSTPTNSTFSVNGKLRDRVDLSSTVRDVLVSHTGKLF